MLKKYLQALLEAFIGSKKEWVSNQSLPDSVYSSQNFVGEGVYKSLTSPINGVCRLQLISEPSSGLFRGRVSSFSGSTEVNGSSILRERVGMCDCWVTCIKGQKVEHMATNGASYTIKFSTKR